MALDKLEAAARKAMADPAVNFIFTDLPKSYGDNPGLLRRLLIAVAEGHHLSQSAAYKAAHSALAQVEETRALRDKIGSLYHDPKIQRAAGDKGIDWYLQRPDAIKEALRDPKIADLLGANLVERIGTTVIEARLFREEHGIAETAPAAEPMPVTAAALQGEIAALRGKSVAGTISKAEDARLTALYERRVGAMPELHEDATDEEKAAHRKALGIPEKPARPDEFRSLISRSVAGKLTPDQDRRLNELSQARAVEQGLVDTDDLSGHGDFGEGTASDES